MSHSYRDGGIVNDSTSPEISSVIEARLSRRDFVERGATARRAAGRARRQS
jgi:hypothetical protein